MGVAAEKEYSVWKSLLESVVGGDATSGSQALSSQDIVAGLKQALEQGARQAVEDLGQANGFLSDARVRIPMPPELERVESALRTFKQDGYVTDRALNGLFLLIAEEEKRIRENPLARSTDILKKVFGSQR